jgi:2-phospho-L-lactate guanylyltransferase
MSEAGVRTTLARVAVLVPVRGLEAAKSRLGEALDAEERRSLVEGLLARTIGAAGAVPGVVAVAVVSPDREALALAGGLGAAAVHQVGGGLNEGLEAGREWARTARPDALLVVPADLPAVDERALAAVIAAGRRAAASGGPGRSTVLLVPDRAGSGTNALLLAPPGAIGFRFGRDSRRAHAELARRAGAFYRELGGPLALDLDTPEDLLEAEALGLGGIRAVAR